MSRFQFRRLPFGRSWPRLGFTQPAFGRRFTLRPSRSGGGVRQRLGTGRTGRSPSFLLLLLILLVFGWATLWYLDRQFAPVVRAIAEEKAKIMATNALNQSVLDQVSEGLKLGDLMAQEKDGSGRVSFIQVNTQLINEVAAKAAQAVAGDLEQLNGQPVHIPLGRILGLDLFAGLGPNIPAKIYPEGYVLVDVKQEFREAGINQTVHIVNLVAKASVRVVVPLLSQDVELTISTPLVTNILPGPVPSNYYGGRGLAPILGTGSQAVAPG